MHLIATRDDDADSEVGDHRLHDWGAVRWVGRAIRGQARKNL